MSWAKTLRKYADALAQIKDFRPTAEYSLEEDIIIEGRERPKKTAKAVEKKEIKDITAATELAPLNYFMDGVQRTILLGHIMSKRYSALIPIQLHISGVVIIDSKGRPVYGPETQIKLIVPKKSFLPRTVIDSIGDDNMAETKDMGEPTYDYAMLRKRGYEKSSHLRDELEQKALREFKKLGKDGYLVFDGTIPNKEDIMQMENIIGLVKNHRKRYLKLVEEAKVFEMPTGHRSWLFEIEREELIERKKKRYTIYSCYLRLRELGHDPLAGLVRVEINPAAKEDIDKICLSIFNERLPVQTNTRSWDRKIYPIYLCERMISAHLPSHEVLFALFKEVI